MDDRAGEVVKEQRSLEAWLHVFGWAFVGIVSFAAGAYFAGLMFMMLRQFGVVITTTNPYGLLLLGLFMYGAMAVLLLAVAWWQHSAFSLKEIGLSRLLEWRDIGLSLAGAILYLLLTVLALKLATFIPGFDASQPQETGLGILFGWDRALAFLVLVVLTPFVEELLFRGMIYGRMRRARVPWWATALIVSILFGVAHLQWNVGIDVFCLSIVLCGLREVTGSIWAGVLVHMLKNAVAFIVVFGVMGF